MLVDDEANFVETMVKRLASRGIEAIQAFSAKSPIFQAVPPAIYSPMCPEPL